MKAFLTACCAGTILMSAGIAAPADAWREKDPSAWTEKEIAQIRKNSPWAQQPREMVRVAASNKQAAPRRTGSKKTNDAGPAPLPSGAGTKSVAVNAQPVMRWESAEPVLAATQRIDPKLAARFAELAKDWYVVSLAGFAMPPEYETPQMAGSEMMSRSFLEIGSKHLKATQVAQVETDGGLTYVLLFPRASKIEEMGKTVAAVIHVGKAHSRASFSVKQMMFGGHATL
jgi:hypothetical protein